MALPEGIPTVTVTGRYLRPDGTPLSGSVVWRAPALITIGDADVMLSGPVTAELDATGAFSVELPATDAPGMVPSGWSYTVTEQLAGVGTQRPGYQILLPAAFSSVDLADLAPTDPTTPTYVAVRGDSAYEVAVEAGFVGTVEQWLASLIGEQGPPGADGATGPTGEQGPAGPEGDSAYEVAVTNGFVGTEAEWLASLVGPEGPQGPAGADGTGSGTVTAVNSVLPDGAGNVTLTAASVGAVDTAERGAASGVATLGADGILTPAQAPAPPPAPGVWLPSDFGLSGWAYDLHANSRTPGDSPAEAQRLYLIGVPLRTAKTVSQVAIHVMGYDKPNATLTNAYFGIYDASFTRLAATTNQIAQLPEVHNVGGQMALINIPSTALAAGFYYVAVLMRRSATTAVPFLAATNWGASATTSGAVAVSSSGVHRWLQSSDQSYSSLPLTGALTAASFTESTTCYWAALV